ncbi:thrombospondin type 3 repeat-containing protein [Chondromyces apiculatus]|uniref:thrombospondin type 3 repeat-containing protein n=1 Tax=Chondromyces apiculatus TaxID=51 RepID=UPI001E5871FE|nr:thrombospondin type 3 repeat-containing protein [Chondromyces apiculatus]
MTSSARAQPAPSVDVRGFRASADPGAGLYLEPAASPGTGDFSAALWLTYGYRPISLRDPTTDESRFSVIGHQLSADLAATVGIAERVALGLDMPVVLYQGGDAPTEASQRVLGEFPLQTMALGDLGLVAKLTAVKPTRGEFGGFALAVHERFTLPTGSDLSYVGEGEVTSETRLLAEYRVVAVGLHLATGVKLRAQEARVACADVAEEACPTRFGHEIPFGLGLTLKPQAFGLDEEGRVTLSLETHGYLPLSPIAPFQSSRVAAAQLGLGARYALRDVSFLVGVETALVGGVGNPPLRALASVAWAPRARDADGDGVPDDQDACRELAEDKDGFQDGDGCPEGDNDEDGVVDEEDRCPGEKEDEDGFEDEDGCPDPDNDGDDVLDVLDACPDEPGPDSADPELRGCPNRDPDQDGIVGEQDRCPNAPEDKDGFEDEDGCPDLDNDSDGFPDKVDACPGEKGVYSEDPKLRGCPDPDLDKDTLLAPEDRCPGQPETWNGVDDADGCPEEDPRKKLKPLVVLRADGGVELSAAVRFTAEGAVDAASMPLLRALASELARRPASVAQVGVRSSPKEGGDEGAARRAGTIVDALRRFARRQSAAEVAAWKDVRGVPRAQAQGVGVKVVEGPGTEARGAERKP